MYSPTRRGETIIQIHPSQVHPMCISNGNLEDTKTLEVFSDEKFLV